MYHPLSSVQRTANLGSLRETQTLKLSSSYPPFSPLNSYSLVANSDAFSILENYIEILLTIWIYSACYRNIFRITFMRNICVHHKKNLEIL